jgi:hypothetical protein
VNPPPPPPPPRVFIASTRRCNPRLPRGVIVMQGVPEEGPVCEATEEQPFVDALATRGPTTRHRKGPRGGAAVEEGDRGPRPRPQNAAGDGRGGDGGDAPSPPRDPGPEWEWDLGDGPVAHQGEGAFKRTRLTARQRVQAALVGAGTWVRCGVEAGGCRIMARMCFLLRVPLRPTWWARSPSPAPTCARFSR